jgi:hypothetical protein
MESSKNCKSYLLLQARSLKEIVIRNTTTSGFAASHSIRKKDIEIIWKKIVTEGLVIEPCLS